MDRFESEIWNKFGHEFIAESDRRKVSFSYSLSIYVCCWLQLLYILQTLVKAQAPSHPRLLHARVWHKLSCFVGYPFSSLLDKY
jgi:hypothetical protein